MELAVKELFEWQHSGAAWLASTKRGILADEMGLGKSATAIEAARLVEVPRVLVVCRNRLRFNWAREIRQWYPIAPVHVVNGNTEQKCDILNDYRSGFALTNYESIRPTLIATVDGKRCEVPNPTFAMMSKLRWDAIIFDEAHWLCNRKSQQFIGAKKLSSKAAYLWLLSGTYIRNRIGDLWSLLHLADRRQWSSYWDFMKRHANARQGFWGWEVDNKATDPAALTQEIHERVLERDRAMLGIPVAQTPPVTTWLSLEDAPPEQARIYRELEQHMLTDLGPQKKLAVANVLAQITRLKQACVSPKLFGGPNVGVKFDAVVESVHQRVKVEGRKVIVFSQFAEALDVLQPRIKSYPYVEIRGGQSDVEQLEAERQFQEDSNINLMYATMTAAGEGLNLTAGSVSMFLDKHWNPNVHAQCRYRTDRFGQTRDIYTEEFHIADTIEEWIENQLDDKQDTITQISSRIKQRYAEGLANVCY